MLKQKLALSLPKIIAVAVRLRYGRAVAMRSRLRCCAVSPRLKHEKRFRSRSSRITEILYSPLRP